MSFGHGSEADCRFEDDGLSRLHATVYRDGDYVWIVDENSSNGTFVNGEKVSSGGTPLKNGDAEKSDMIRLYRVELRQSKLASQAAVERNEFPKNRSRFRFFRANTHISSLAIIGIAF